MLSYTTPLKPFKANRHFFYKSKAMPQGTVALSYIEESLAQRNMVHINNLSNNIKENQSIKDETFYADEGYLLVPLDKEGHLPHEAILVTDKWHNNVPLHYTCELKESFTVLSPLDIESIFLEITMGNSLPLPDNYVWTSELREDNGKYKIVIYSNFSYHPFGNLEARYILPQDIPNKAYIKEPLFFVPLFSKASTLSDSIHGEGNKYFVAKTSSGSNKIYVKNKAILDPRERLKFNWQIKAEITTGSTTNIYYSSVFEDYIFHTDQIMPHEENTEYLNKRKIISNVSPRQIMQGMIPAEEFSSPLAQHVYRIEILNNSDIVSATRLSGFGKIYATTSLLSGKPKLNIGRYYPLNKEEFINGQLENRVWFAPIYQIKYIYPSNIRVIAPDNKNKNQPWYLKIQNGKFVKEVNGKRYMYAITEYLNQNFSEEFGAPISSILNESPEIVGDYSLQTKNKNLFLQTIENYPANTKVFDGERELVIRHINQEDGIIDVSEKIINKGSINVSYDYVNSFYEYKGYLDELSQRFWHLNVNPHPGQTFTNIDSGDGHIKELDSLQLISRPIFIYLKPLCEVDENNNIISVLDTKQSVFHSFKEIQSPEILLIAQIFVNNKSNVNNIEIHDIRKRGGGLKQSISEELMLEKEPESLWYWDIGVWDGDPYTENSVLIFKFSKAILQEHGGSLTVEDVESAIKKHITYGTLYIVEYL